MGASVLDFAVAYGMSIVNSYFKKREEHLVTFSSGSARTQIDYFLMRANSRRWCRDSKVLPSECLTTQHRLLVLDVEIRDTIRRKRKVGVYKVKWWNLKGENGRMRLSYQKRLKVRVNGNLTGTRAEFGRIWRIVFGGRLERS